jgi:hypothetical protein
VICLKRKLAHNFLQERHPDIKNRNLKNNRKSVKFSK